MIERYARLERRLLRRGWRGRLALEIVWLGLAFVTCMFSLYFRVELARRSGVLGELVI